MIFNKMAAPSLLMRFEPIWKWFQIVTLPNERFQARLICHVLLRETDYVTLASVTLGHFEQFHVYDCVGDCLIEHTSFSVNE